MLEQISKFIVQHSRKKSKEDWKEGFEEEPHGEQMMSTQVDANPGERCQTERNKWKMGEVKSGNNQLESVAGSQDVMTLTSAVTSGPAAGSTGGDLRDGRIGTSPRSSNEVLVPTG